MKKKNFLVGAFILSIGGVVSKILGAVYRIPLMNIVGASVFGRYQLIFPIYALMFTLSSTGIPVAISKLMSENIAIGRNIRAKRIFISSFILSLALGILGFGIVVSLSRVLALSQNDVSLTSGYLLIAPALFFVSIISCIRGYFQSLQNMAPTAVSQVIEQAVKLGLGLVLSSLAMPNEDLAFKSIIFSVFISEVVATIYLIIRYFFKRDKLLKVNVWRQKKCYKSVIKFALPITIAVCLIPLSQFLDSIIIIRLLSYTDNATELFGFFSGCVNSFNSMPIALSAGLAVAVIPKLSSLKATGQEKELNNKLNLSLKLTIIIALPCTLGVFLLSENIASVLYYNLSAPDIAIIARLLKWGSFNILLMSLMQISVSVLQSQNKIYVPVLSLAIGIALQIAGMFILIRNQRINILGAIFSQEICYFVAFIINLIYIIKYRQPKFNYSHLIVKPIVSSFSMFSVIFALKSTVLKGNGILTLSLLVLSGICIYVLMVFILGMIKNDVRLLRKNKRA